MKALSISQPFAWLIVNGFKDIENRDWHPGRYRGPLLIHAPRKVDEHSFMPPYPRHLTLNFLKAPYPEHMPVSEDDYEKGGIVGIAQLVDVVTRSSSVWFRGKYGLVLRDAKPLPFTPLRGYPGIFDVPDEIVAPLMEMATQIKEKL